VTKPSASWKKWIPNRKNRSSGSGNAFRSNAQASAGPKRPTIKKPATPVMSAKANHFGKTPLDENGRRKPPKIMGAKEPESVLVTAVTKSGRKVKTMFIGQAPEKKKAKIVPKVDKTRSGRVVKKPHLGNDFET
jgi:hypothetical protein